jgi:hypothetical protein
MDSLNSSVITVPFHYYRYDLDSRIDDREQVKAEYEALIATIKATGLKCSSTIPEIGNSKHRDRLTKIRAIADNGIVEIETKFLFDNQFNSPELRLYFWEEYDYPNKDIKEGYYIELTEEYREILSNTVQCKFCGKQEIKSDKVFCSKCLGNEYLTEDSLELTILTPIIGKKIKVSTEQLQARILEFQNLQDSTMLSIENITEALSYMSEEYRKDLAELGLKRFGYLVLLGLGIHPKNAIYHARSNEWVIGNSRKFSKRQANILRQKLVDIEIKVSIKEQEN